MSWKPRLNEDINLLSEVSVTVRSTEILNNDTKGLTTFINLIVWQCSNLNTADAGYRLFCCHFNCVIIIFPCKIDLQEILVSSISYNYR